MHKSIENWYISDSPFNAHNIKLIQNVSGTYSPEKQKYPYHKYPPQYSFGSRTKTGKKDRTPGPNMYNLPGILGPKAVGKKSAPSYSLVGRSKIGGFHEDLQRVWKELCHLFHLVVHNHHPHHYQYHYHHHHHLITIDYHKSPSSIINITSSITITIIFMPGAPS
jgi:hypothetical protein